MIAERQGIVAGATAYLLWGLLTIYWKQLHGLDALQLTSFRIVFSAGLLVIALSATRAWGPLLALRHDRSALLRLVVAAVLLTANWLTYVWAVGHDRVTETALGYFIAPLATMLIGIVRFGEVASTLRRIALALAAIAIVVLVVAYGEVPYVAIILAGTWSIYGTIKRGVPLNPLQSLGGETFVLFVPATVVVVVAALGGSLLEGASGGQWAYVCMAGVVTAVPLLLFAAAARVVPFTILGPLNYLVPTINFVLGVVVYDEVFDTARLIGFAFVWAGLVLIAIDGMRPRRPQPILVAGS